ncbi:MAG: hypothetical protein QNK04_03695 [Myxococcota bacterium]|nr:hypothetical protein [Myxococcota bacterium]
MTAATAAPLPDAAEGMSRLARFGAGSGAVWAVAALALGFQLPIFDRWFSFMDEGHMLLYADLIANGGDLYRDATVYPLPGAFYFLALVFHVFEPSNLVARWVVVLQFSGFVALGFVLLRRFAPLRVAFAGVVLLLVYRVWAFPHWHMYNYSTTALLVQLAALLVLLDAFPGFDRRRIALAGLLFGLGVSVKQDYGAAALLALGTTLALQASATRRDARPGLGVLFATFLVPAAGVGAAVGLYFWQAGILGDLLQFTVFNHFIGMSSYEYSTFPSLFPLFEQDPVLRGRAASAYIPGILLTADWRNLTTSDLYRDTAIVDTALKAYYYAPYAVLALAALRLWLRRAALRSDERRQAFVAEFALFALGAALLLLVSLNRPQDYVHLAVLYWPILLLAAVCVHGALHGRRLLAWGLVALFLLPAGAALSYTGKLWWRIRTDHTAAIDSPRAGILVRPSQAELLNQLVAYVQEESAPDEPVAVMPYFPILSFYADRRGPHRSSYIVWPFPEFPDRDQRVIDAMEATGADLLLYNFTQFTVFNPVAEYAPDLYAYLVENFEIDRVFSTEIWGYKLAGLKRRAEPHGGELLGGPATPVEVSLRDAWSPPRPVEPEERRSYAELALWPFRPALAMRPSRGGQTVLSVPLEVPTGAILHSSVSVHPKRWYHADPAWSEFELAVVDGARRETVYQRRLRPTPDLGDRGWFDVEVDLSAWAGREVLLEFSAETNKRSGESLLQAAWGLPRIVVKGG